jgi:hypothetical protein
MVLPLRFPGNLVKYFAQSDTNRTGRANSTLWIHEVGGRLALLYVIGGNAPYE